MITRFIWNQLLPFTTGRRARAHQSMKTAAMNDLRFGDGRPPSWHRNSDRLLEFHSGIRALSMSRGIFDEYIDHVVANENNCQRLITYAGAIEARGATFAEQQIAVADQIFEWWHSHLRIEAAIANSFSSPGEILKERRSP